ncbi:MBL fold metallo-hydrolase [Clostridium gasigenes]|uniref:ComEC/Rec2 family competence protein n=1 Tax=Clostridium gasigenes TaxID=94869 RepID=UPI001C0CC13B|nr:ComEC/Rec2 family competence protein [Clostridium gasigenes]MBU3089866.1 MBL fold metallo-hydrolase [Clostridium gasigenes]MBU3107611.1 MBL fold metallo-hydrolase [Clostridium gasigenes]
MKKKFSILSLLILIFAFIFSFYNLLFTPKKNLNPTNKMIVHYIDVGQGDSILIQVNNKNLLIDAGPKDAKENLLTYLDSIGLSKLDYIIATHPHEDHIGSMSSVINKYEVGKFYAPKVEHTTSTFEKMVESLITKDLKINIIKAGIDTIDLGKGTNVTVFSPSKEEYSNLNDYSPIIKIEYGNNSFLFTGDAEVEVEKEVLSKNPNIKSDVLKLGHHGSSTSTSKTFLNAVNPSIGVISAGVDNKYGHPTNKTLTLLNTNNIKFYRTDLDGTIVLSSNGTEINRIPKK